MAEIIFYILSFLAIYVQVFFLVAFMERRRELLPRNIATGICLPSATAIVPCYNKAGTIFRTVRSLLDLDYPSNKLHIILVDDGSTDGSFNIMQRLVKYPNVKIFRKEGGGKHTALNLALSHVETELVVSLDADTEFDRRALRETVAYFMRDARTAAVGGTVLINNPKSVPQKAQSIEYQSWAFSKKVLGLLGGVLVVPGAFSVFRTEIVRAVGGYRCGHNLEDLELTYRLQFNGYKVDHCHTAIAYTRGPGSLRALFRQRLRWSTGFFKNTIDYRRVIFNKKFGNFGIFTVPMAIVTYPMIITIFSLSWYFLLDFLIRKITEIRLIGFHPENLFSWSGLDFFYVDTRAVALLAVFIYTLIIVFIILGRRIIKSSVKDWDSHGFMASIFWFFLVYSFIPAFWIIKSFYHAATARLPAWR